MEHKPGQVAEYGTQEFNKNQSVYTVIEKGKTVNDSGVVRDVELYHRTEGYKPTGSCAIWTLETWGYRIFFSDGTTGGKMFREETSAREAWDNLTDKKRALQILSDNKSIWLRALKKGNVTQERYDSVLDNIELAERQINNS
jgi:hypothetical protein